MKHLAFFIFILFSSITAIGQIDKFKNDQFNPALSTLLDSIHFKDQHLRLQLDSFERIYNFQSPEMQSLYNKMAVEDSENLKTVKYILDNYGWLGANVVGKQGNNTIFLVIQHADQTTQEAYLPMMRESVKNGNAQKSALALLEDRVNIGQGKRQIYGSQVAMYFEDNKYYLRPLSDPDNVDKRRAEANLQPLAAYLSRWGIVWNAEQYKKDLPIIEAKEKAKAANN
ncbi:MAG: DUF6624 domain-containing protein [Ferruginibacter sp.]